MNHGELVSAFWIWHGAAFAMGLAAMSRYGGRTEIPGVLLEGTEGLLKRMRGLLTEAFASALKPLMQLEPSPILTPNGSAYTEHPLDVARSDAFIERLDDFVYVNAALLADYRLALRARASWYLCTKWVRWISRCLVVWELAALAAVGSLDKMGVCSIPDPLLLWAALPTALCFLPGLAAWMLCLRHCDAVSDLRNRYDAP